MEYTIKKLSEIAGISTRTLRYYDELGLLTPERISSSGYRIYGEKQINILQQILFYRELGVALEDIKNILSDESFNIDKALEEHRERLLQKQQQINLLITNIDKTIASRQGGKTMKDNEKFEGFKEKMIQENEAKYGSEIREKYGKDTVEKSYQKLKGMSREQMKQSETLAIEILDLLPAAMATGDPASEAAQELFRKHKEWLCFWWPEYSAEAHAGLGQMYVDDERFRKYYDDVVGTGGAEFLRDAILHAIRS